MSALGNVVLLVGVALVGIAALGLLRLPDVYNRTNAVAKAASLGLVLVLLGVALRTPDTGAVVVLLVAAVLQLFTVPIAGFEVGQAARLTGAPLTDRTHTDELGVGDREPEEDPRSR
ncbi:monovalent cation/H(+) antiporter subunit G [Modestobacter sp. SYSU DS0657]